MRKPFLVSITSNYGTTLTWLDELSADKEFSKSRAESIGFTAKFETFDTFFKLEMLRFIFTIMEDASVKLQAVQLNFSMAAAIIEQLRQTFFSARQDHRFEILYSAAVTSAKELNLGEPELPRRRRVPASRAGRAEQYFPATPEEHYQKLYFSAVDGVISGLTDRFEPTETTKHLKEVEAFLIHAETSFEYIKDFLKDDFEDYKRLALEREEVLDEPK